MEQTQQLELFDSVCQKKARRSVLISEPIQLTFRQDHGVLLVIAVLVATSAIFAFGVERGKRIAKPDMPLIQLQKVADKTQENTTKTETKTTNTKETNATAVSIKKAQDIAPTKNANTPKVEEKAKTKLASSSKQFAIQVVSFKKNDLAHKELARLKSKGEPVFMIMKEGRASLLIGPFKNKENASAKLPGLRKKYQDCFIRTLSGYNATTM